MPVRFNPPPGWQVPPGFRPDSTWAPDPSWPPAPPGWNYWVKQIDSSPTSRSGSPTSPANTMGATFTMAPIGAPPAPVPPPPPTRPPPGPGPLSYDDAHHGQPGREVTVAAGHIPARQPSPPPKRQSRSRTPGVGRMIAIGVACLALGVIIGVIVMTGQQAQANQAMSDAKNLQAQLEEQHAEIEAQQEQNEKKRDELTAREKELGSREAKVKEQENALEQQLQQQKENDRNTRRNRNTGTIFYWNCDAVRAAGAAPLANTQPGYQPHLDRNRNGFACEIGE